MSMLNFVIGASTGADGQPLELPNVEYSLLSPQLILIAAALAILLVSSVTKERLSNSFFAGCTVVAGCTSLLAAAVLWWDLDQPDGQGRRAMFAGALAHDYYSLFFVGIIGVAITLSALVARDWLEQHDAGGPEFYVLTMLSGAGGMFMASANDLIVVFLGLEILSIALYVLTGFHRRSERSREAAIKYFVLGGFSSAIFLYGIALIYGATGSTNLAAIATFLSENVLFDEGLLLAGIFLLFIGFAFKVAAVPFHQWTPDVYEGAPVPATAFMAAAAKAAGFAALLKVFAATFFTLRLDWQPVVLAVACLTLLVGSIVACVQRDVKRMLAYSSISHAGYILLGLHAVNEDGIAGALFYLLAYTFIVIGSFAVVMVVTRRNENNQDIERYRGLGRRNPLLALCFAVLLLAQAGVPLTSGFLAKFYVIAAQAENGSYATAVFAMLMASVAAFFYLRLIVVMYGAGAGAENRAEEAASESAAPDPVETSPTSDSGAESTGSRSVLLQAEPIEAVTPGPLEGAVAVPAATAVVIGLCVFVTVLVGVLPSGQLAADVGESGRIGLDVVDFVRTAANDIF